MLFFRHAATFLSKRATAFFLLKADVLFDNIFSKRTLIAKKMKKYLHDTYSKYYIENISHQLPDL